MFMRMNHASIENVNRKQWIRYRVLFRLYNIAGDNVQLPVSDIEIRNKEYMGDAALQKAKNYLGEEGLISYSDNYSAITHKGIKEIEDSIQNPNKPTEHFPTIVIQNYYENVMGGVQVGGEGNSQTVSIMSGGKNGTE